MAAGDMASISLLEGCRQMVRRKLQIVEHFPQVSYERLTKEELPDLSRRAPKSKRLSELRKDGLWRPFTLRSPTLLLFLLLTIGLIATIEALNHMSTRNGALSLSYILRMPGGDWEFSKAQIFCYRYLPQVVVVLYGIAWAAVDLDVKRLEPYFQLSKPGGASASESIFLHYPFDFLALVPITAVKRRFVFAASILVCPLTAHRHWSVFTSGTALVLIFWVIAPLQSSLITIEPVVQEIHTKFLISGELMTYNSQAGYLDTSFLFSSYGVTWLGDITPPFMDRDVIAMPFASSGRPSRDDTWIAVTRVYQTHIDCTPATVIEPGESDHGAYNFTTENCSHSLNPLPDEAATRNLMYIGHGNSSDGMTQWYLRESECAAKGIFLGVWAKSRLPATRSTDIDVSGIFCHTKYSYSDADITVNRGQRITNISFIGEPKPLTAEDKIFDIDFFEHYLGAGCTMESADTRLFPNVAPTTQARYEGWGLWSPTGQVGYAIGLENKSFDDFRDLEVFGEAMNKSQKLLFNYAVYHLFKPTRGYPMRPHLNTTWINGTWIHWKDGIVVVPEIAHLLSGFLSAVAVCLAGLFFHSRNRRNNLSSDPDTLAATMSLVAQSPQLLRDFEGADNCPEISGCIKRRRYKLGPLDRGGGHRLDIVGGEDITTPDGSHKSSTKPHDGRGIRPWELSARMGAGTTIFSAGLLVLLAVLFRSSQKYSGRRLPASIFHQCSR